MRHLTWAAQEVARLSYEAIYINMAIVACQQQHIMKREELQQVARRTHLQRDAFPSMSSDIENVVPPWQLDSRLWVDVCG
jgi:hypothetical protein